MGIVPKQNSPPAVLNTKMVLLKSNLRAGKESTASITAGPAHAAAERIIHLQQSLLPARPYPIRES